MITIDLNAATDAWWEANKANDWREQQAARSEWYRSNTYVNPKMSFVEMALEAAGHEIIFYRMVDETSWGKITFEFNDEDLSRDRLRILMDIEILVDSRKFSFHSVEAFVHENHDRGYDGEMVTSSYPRISVIFRVS